MPLLGGPPNSPSIRQYLPTSTRGLCQPDYLVNKLTTRYNMCAVRTSNLRNSLLDTLYTYLQPPSPPVSTLTSPSQQYSAALAVRYDTMELQLEPEATTSTPRVSFKPNTVDINVPLPAPSTPPQPTPCSTRSYHRETSTSSTPPFPFQALFWLGKVGALLPQAL